ncbi:unnamed protein product [Rhizoctonia solani]|uniref:Stress-response A/B barrel domain-containing protein n=1 Tax=Rhizoctonia solani TaxID=456999 RepID=A0A8H3BNU9_9AGAM|nr:unnamed protein product [Rhizoctonia solani]
MIIHIVIWKLKSQPDATGGSQVPATFTDATATGVIEATQEQIDAYKAESRREIAEALNKVPGPLVPMQFGPPQLPERAKGYEFALYSRFKDLESLKKYAVSDAHVSVVESVVKPRTIPGETMAYDLEVPDDT